MHWMHQPIDCAKRIVITSCLVPGKQPLGKKSECSIMAVRTWVCCLHITWSSSQKETSKIKEAIWLVRWVILCLNQLGKMEKHYNSSFCSRGMSKLEHYIEQNLPPSNFHWIYYFLLNNVEPSVIFLPYGKPAGIWVQLPFLTTLMSWMTSSSSVLLWKYSVKK